MSIAHDACRGSQEWGGPRAPLELGRLISYRGETDCGKRPRFFQLKTNATVMFKKDFQEALKFQWIEKGIWIVTTESEDRASWGRIYHGGKTGRTNSCIAHQEDTTGSPEPMLNKKLIINS